jgi:hypothetical protein
MWIPHLPTTTWTLFRRPRLQISDWPYGEWHHPSTPVTPRTADRIYTPWIWTRVWLHCASQLPMRFSLHSGTQCLPHLPTIILTLPCLVMQLEKKKSQGTYGFEGTGLRSPVQTQILTCRGPRRPWKYRAYPRHCTYRQCAWLGGIWPRASSAGSHLGGPGAAGARLRRGEMTAVA